MGEVPDPGALYAVSAMYKPENLVKFTGLMPATLSGRDAAENLKDPKYDIYWKILTENADNPIPLSDKLVEQCLALFARVK